VIRAVIENKMYLELQKFALIVSEKLRSGK
jgi:hypothetical protein